MSEKAVVKTWAQICGSQEDEWAKKDAIQLKRIEEFKKLTVDEVVKLFNRRVNDNLLKQWSSKLSPKEEALLRKYKVDGKVLVSVALDPTIFCRMPELEVRQIIMRDAGPGPELLTWCCCQCFFGFQ